MCSSLNEEEDRYGIEASLLECVPTLSCDGSCDEDDDDAAHDGFSVTVLDCNTCMPQGREGLRRRILFRTVSYPPASQPVHEKME